MQFKSYLLIVSVFWGTTLFADVKPKISIESVSTKPLNSTGQNFSTEIIFDINTGNYPNWKFGFYMPRTFNSLKANGTDINPELKMSISNLAENKIPTQLKNVFEKKSNSFSAGYVTVLEPVANFDLKTGNKYRIFLDNNNQWAPNNYSAMPQSFYLIVKDKEGNFDKVINIPSNPSNYLIGGYSQKDVDTTIAKHYSDNLKNSNANTTLADKYGIVPSPVSVIENEDGSFLLKDKNINLHSDAPNLTRKVANIMISALKKDLNTSVKVSYFDTESEDGIIFKKISDPSIIDNSPEGYRVTISSSSILIEAIDQAGFFYAFETLRNLWNTNSEGNLPRLTIIDYPRYSYRGISLDVSRHFQSTETIKKLIDVMAAQKLNTLHLHLADDEGWRILLKNYASLINVSKRGIDPSSILTPAMLIQSELDGANYKNVNDSSSIIDNKYTEAQTLYSGIYSKADMKRLIRYANDRNITIIPEVSLPGHARALVYSYPEIFIDKNDKSDFISIQGYNDDAIPVCLYNSDSKQGKEFTKTINGIIKGVVDIFDKQTTNYFIENEISVGGDEVSSKAWSKDSSATGQWDNKTALEKSIYFFKLLQSGTNVVMSGWQQFVQKDDGTIDSNISVQANKVGHVWVWNPVSSGGISQAQELVKNGYNVVLCYADIAYFDLTYTPDKWEPGFKWAGQFIDTQSALSMAYYASKTLDNLNQNEKAKINGIEGTLWSENIPNEHHLFYSALPKMSGLAEAAWSPSSITTNDEGQVNWKSLRGRLGTDNSMFLGYLNKVYDVFYRGYPNGISKE